MTINEVGPKINSDPAGTGSEPTKINSSAAGGSRPARKSWWRRPWVIPLAVLTTAFLVYALPPYLSLDPATARLPVPPSAIYYPTLVTHIFLGSLMLCCATLQVWPWLRRSHLRIHRISGRIYVVSAIGVGIGGIIVAQFPHGGPVQQVGNTLLGVLLLITTVQGYRAVRQGRIAEHREWMLRSFALAFSIVANRLWLVICMIIFAPTGEGEGLTAAIGISTWMSWVVNLMIAEWWLHRRRHGRSGSRPTGSRTQRA
ncbi:MAG TPA: DUF2306 domain-containing protein [Microlunatus sp.]